MTPPVIVKQRQTTPGLACICQIKTLMTSVRDLFTKATTVNAVMEIALLAASPKKLMSRSNQFPALAPGAAKTSFYSPVMIQNNGAIIRETGRVEFCSKA